jgi:hypothetical protein
LIPRERAAGILLSVTQYGILVVGVVWLLVVWLGRKG